MLPVTITPSSINILLDGRMRTISTTHINFDKVRTAVQAIQRDPTASDLLDDLRAYVDIPTFIAKVTEGRVRVGERGVLFDSEPVKGVIADRLMASIKEGYDPRPLARFLQRLKTNPLTTAIDEMYLWLESGNLPITADGCFLAFKLVEEDFASTHRNPDGSKLYNCPGSVVSMPREEVDPNRSQTCSVGLHFCSFQYLPNFGFHSEGSRVVVVKVAPEDVVAIPYDYNNSKGRAWRYLVLEEVPKDDCEHLFSNRPVVDSFGCYDNSETDDGDSDGDSGDDYFSDDDASADDGDGDGDGDGDEPESEADSACFNSCDETCTGVDPDCPLYNAADAEMSTGYDHSCCEAEGADEGEPDDMVFTYVPVGKKLHKTLTTDEVKSMVADYGQRGMSRMTGIPRTTIQEWLKRIG